MKDLRIGEPVCLKTGESKVKVVRLALPNGTPDKDVFAQPICWIPPANDNGGFGTLRFYLPDVNPDVPFDVRLSLQEYAGLIADVEKLRDRLAQQVRAQLCGPEADTAPNAI